ncbi:hypothetical protein C8R44DRAFT_865259 [Mycena epipterygia]|nr:hypothetical protein C8R44DRAFT_865259 [Mycena epipterygia]
MSDAIILDATPNKVTVTNKGLPTLDITNASATSLTSNQSVDIGVGIDKSVLSVQGSGAVLATVWNDSQDDGVHITGVSTVSGTGPITVLVTLTTA